jgi:hypothetical protein
MNKAAYLLVGPAMLVSGAAVAQAELSCPLVCPQWAVPGSSVCVRTCDPGRLIRNYEVSKARSLSDIAAGTPSRDQEEKNKDEHKSHFHLPHHPPHGTIEKLEKWAAHLGWRCRKAGRFALCYPRYK